jgi:hypothetical protein
MKHRLLVGGIAVGVCILTSAAAYQYAQPAQVLSVLDGWHEIAWPFPRDAWPAGRAYRCPAATCGDDIELYARPKIGFCNCDTGVADDDEVDRVADLDLLSEKFVPLEPGKVVHVADMAGRARNYDLRMRDGSHRLAVGIAASRRCDLMVAVAVGKPAAANVVRKALDFLGSNAIAGWMVASMTGR